MFYGALMTEILNQTKPHMANTQKYNIQWKKSPKITVCFKTHPSSWIWFCLIEGQRGHPYILDATALIGNSFLRLQITSRWETHIHLHKWLRGFTLTRIHLCKTYSFSLFIWINKCLNFSTNEADNLSNISHILPSPLTFDSCSYHDRNTGNKVCLGLYTYITKVVCSSRNPCYQFWIKDIRKSYSISIHTWDIYICASRFIYFRLAQFEETNGVLHYRTIIKQSLSCFEKSVYEWMFHTHTTTYLVHLGVNSEVRLVSVVNLFSVNTMSVTHLL